MHLTWVWCIPLMKYWVGVSTTPNLPSPSSIHKGPQITNIPHTRLKRTDFNRKLGARDFHYLTDLGCGSARSSNIVHIPRFPSSILRTIIPGTHPIYRSIQTSIILPELTWSNHSHCPIQNQLNPLVEAIPSGKATSCEISEVHHQDQGSVEWPHAIPINPTVIYRNTAYPII